MATPNLSDILGYYGEDGEASMLDYLTDLYFKSLGSTEGGDDWGGGLINKEEDLLDFLNFASSESNIPFSQMSYDDIQGNLSKYHTSPDEGRIRTQQGSNIPLDEEKLGNIIQALQEGFKATQSPDAFGYGQKISDIQTTGKRDIKSAYESYIPTETLSRYGALQNIPGAEQAGEAKEIAYLSDIYGIKRGTGRDVRETQKDYEEDWFSGIENWLSNVSS
jgi:hypothetical protein